MANLESTATPKPKSAAASRILRAVEKARGSDHVANSTDTESAHPEERTQALHIDPQPEPVPSAPLPLATDRPAEEATQLEPAETLRTLAEHQSPVSTIETIDNPVPVTVAKPVEQPAAPEKSVNVVAEPAPAPAPPAPAPVPTKAKQPSAKKKTEAPPEPSPVAEAPRKKGTAQPEKTEPQQASEQPAKPLFEAPALGMGPNPKGSLWANMPVALKGLLCLAIVGGGGFGVYQYAGKPDTQKSPDTKATSVFVPMSVAGGWAPNWGGEPARNGGRAINIFRPSLHQVNYRIEFEGQIESKGFGWVFRAKDPQNYYGYRVEAVKPGLQPLVALARIVVINGNEGQKHYTLLEKAMRSDTTFRIRMDAVNTQFSTWINDQLIEVWKDDRIPSGALGLFTEKDDRAQIRKVQFFEMR